MNILRPRILSLHKIISWNANTSNFATKYWKRTNCSYSWNMLRPCHILYTARSTDNEYTSYAHSPNNATILSPNIRCKVSSLQLIPTSLLYIAHMGKMSIRGMSSIKSKSKNGNFSTIGVPDSTSANNDDKQDDKQDLDSLPASQKAKILFKKYGAVFVGTYFGIYFTTLFSFFVALDFGLLDPDVLSQIFKTSKNMACETAGKSAFVLFYHVHMCFQCEVLVIWHFICPSIAFICLPLQPTCTNICYVYLSSSS